MYSHLNLWNKGNGNNINIFNYISLQNVGYHGYLQIRFRNWHDLLGKISFISLCLLHSFELSIFRLIHCHQYKPEQFKLRYYYYLPWSWGWKWIELFLPQKHWHKCLLHRLVLGLNSGRHFHFFSGNNETYFLTGILFYWTAFIVIRRNLLLIQAKYNWDIDCFFLWLSFSVILLNQ